GAAVGRAGRGRVAAVGRPGGDRQRRRQREAGEALLFLAGGQGEVAAGPEAVGRGLQAPDAEGAVEGRGEGGDAAVGGGHGDEVGAGRAAHGGEVAADVEEVLGGGERHGLDVAVAGEGLPQ